MSSTCDADQSTTSSRPLDLTVVLPLPLSNLGHRQTAEAVRLAVDEINAGLGAASDWRMKSVVLDSERSVFNETNLFLAHLHSDHPVAFIGLPTTVSVHVAAPIAGALSVPAITVTVADRDTRPNGFYPTLLRACPSDILIAGVVKDLVQHFSWTKTCFIHSDDFSGVYAARDIISRAPQYGISIMKTVFVDYTQEGNLTTSTLDGLKVMKDKACHIIVANLHSTEFLSVMRAANSIGLIAKGNAWILPQFLSGPELLSDEVRKYLEGSLVIRPSMQGNEENLKVFARKLNARKPSICPSATTASVSLEAVFAYDVTNLLGDALKKWVANGDGALPALDCTGKLSVSKNIHLYPWKRSSQLLGLIKSSVHVGGGGPMSLANPSRGTNYDIFSIQDRSLIRIGNWSYFDGLNMQPLNSGLRITWTGGTYEVPSGKGFANETLKILVPLSRPFTFLLNDPPTKNEDFAGVAIDILKSVSTLAGFNYTLIRWSGTWNRMVEVAGDPSNDIDLAIGSITVTKNRSRYCNFSRSIYLTGLRMAVKRPATIVHGQWDFFAPLDWTVWLVLVVTLLTTAAILTQLDSEGVRTDRQGSLYFDSLFFSLCTFFFVHEADEIKRGLARIFLVVVQFSMLVLVASYTANMANFLSNREETSTVSSYADLFNKRVAVRPGTTNYDYVKDEMGLRYLVEVNNAVEATEKLRSGEADAYIADSPHLTRMASESCDVVIVSNQVM